MRVAAQKIVTIEYTLKDEEGEVLDSSEGRDPLAYVHGVGSLVSGLEKALDGKSAGDAVVVSVPCEDGYGARDEALISRIAVRKLQGGKGQKVQVGMQFRAQTEDGFHNVLVTEVRGDYATVDANHPLAGATLNFDVKVVSVRDATEEELKHGHVHGPGGHDH